MTTPWELAGFATEEEWREKGWPAGINPATGEQWQGYEMWRMQGGRHPDGRKMDDADWRNPHTQAIFDFLRQRRLYRNPLWDWYGQMRAKYPQYPVPGINVEALLRQAFPDWYEAERAPGAPPLPTLPESVRKQMEVLGITPPGVPTWPTEEPPPPAEVPAEEAPPTPEVSPELQRWMGWARREERPGLPTMVPTEEELDARRAAIREWAAYLPPDRRAELEKRLVAEEEAPVAPPVSPVESLQQFLARIREYVGKPPLPPEGVPERPTARPPVMGLIPELTPEQEEGRLRVQDILRVPWDYYLKPLFQGLYEVAKVPERGLFVRGKMIEQLEEEPGGIRISSASDLVSTALAFMGLPPRSLEDIKAETVAMQEEAAKRGWRGWIFRPPEMEQPEEIEELRRAFEAGEIGYSLMGDRRRWYPDPDKGVATEEEEGLISASDHAILMLEAGKTMPEVMEQHEHLATELIGNIILDPAWLIPGAWMEKALPVGKAMGLAAKALKKVPGVGRLITTTKAGRVRTYGYAISDAMDRFMINMPGDESVGVWLGRMLLGDEEALATLGVHDRKLLTHAAATFKRHDSTWQAIITKYSPEAIAGMPPAKKAATMAKLKDSLQSLAERIIRKTSPADLAEMEALLERDPRKIGRWLAEGLTNLKRRELGLKPIEARGALYRGMAFSAQLWKEAILPINIAFHQVNLLDSTVRMSLRGYFWSPGDLPVLDRILQKLTGRQPLGARVTRELEKLGLTLPRELQTSLLRELLDTEGYRLKTRYAMRRVPVPFIGKPRAIFDAFKKLTGNDLVSWAAESSTKGGLRAKIGKLIGAVRFEDASIPIATAQEMGKGYEYLAKAMNRMNLASLVEAGAEDLNIEPLVRITTFWKEADPLFNQARFGVADLIESTLLEGNPGREAIIEEIAEQVRNPNAVQSVADLGALLDGYIADVGPRLDAFKLSFRHIQGNDLLMEIARETRRFGRKPTTESALDDIFAYGQRAAEENYSKIVSQVAPEEASMEQLRLAGAPEHLPDEILQRKAQADAAIRRAYKRMGRAVQRIEDVRGSDVSFLDLGRTVSSKVNREVWQPHWDWYYNDFWPGFEAKLDYAKAVGDSLEVSRLWASFRESVPPKFDEVGQKAAQYVDDLTKEFLEGVPTDELLKALDVFPEERVTEAVAPEVALPEGWRMEVGKTKVKDGVPALAELDYEGKRIIFAHESATRSPEIFGHEIAHLHYEELSEPARKALVEDYIKVADITPKEIEQRVFNEWVPMDYAEYIRDPSSVKPEVAAVFEKHFPAAEAVAPEVVEEAPGLVDRILEQEAERVVAEDASLLERAKSLYDDTLEALTEMQEQAVGKFRAAKEVAERGIIPEERVAEAVGARGRLVQDLGEQFGAMSQSEFEAGQYFIRGGPPSTEFPGMDVATGDVAIAQRFAPAEKLQLMKGNFDNPYYINLGKREYEGIRWSSPQRLDLERLAEEGYDAIIARAGPQGKVYEIIPLKEGKWEYLGEIPLPTEQLAITIEGMETTAHNYIRSLTAEAAAPEVAEGLQPVAERLPDVAAEVAPRPLLGLDELKTKAMRQMADGYEGAVAQGIETVHELFYDYAARKGVDELLWWASPFTIWQTRNPFGWAKAIARKPAIVNVIRRTMRLTEAEREERALPGRFEGTVPIPEAITKPLVDQGIIPDGYYSMDVRQFFSIWGQSPAIEGDLPWGWEDEPMLGKVIRTGEFIGIRTYPWWQIPLERMGAYGSVPASDLTYFTKFIRAITKAAGREVDIEKPLREWRDRNEQNGIARYYGNLRLLDYFFKEEISMEELVEAVGNPGNPLFNQAEQEAADWHAKLGLVRGLEPFTVKHASPAEQEARLLQREYFNLAVPQRAAFRDEHPLLVAYWAVLRDPEEAGESRRRQRREQWSEAVRHISAVAMAKVPLGTKAYEDIVDRRRAMLDQVQDLFPYEPRRLLLGGMQFEAQKYFALTAKFFDEEGGLKEEFAWEDYYAARDGFMDELVGEYGDPSPRLAFEQYLAQNEQPADAIVRAWETLYGQAVWDVINEQRDNEDRTEANRLIAEAKKRADQGRKDVQGLLAEVLRLHPDWTAEQVYEAKQARKKLQGWDVWSRRNQPLRDALESVIWSGYMGLDDLARKQFREFIREEAGANVADSFEKFMLDRDRRNINDVSSKVLLQIADYVGGLINLQREGFQRDIEETEKEYELEPIERPAGIPEGGEEGAGAGMPAPPTKEGRPGEQLARLPLPGPKPPGWPQRLPWSYHQRVGRYIDLPEDFWAWIQGEYPIRPDWEPVVTQAKATVDLLNKWGGGYYGEGEIVSRYPQDKLIYQHELGHYMDETLGTPGHPVSATDEWRDAVKRWIADPRYPRSGKNIEWLIENHPLGYASKESPSWNEAYADAARLTDVPPYIRHFLPWRDWAEIDDLVKRAQIRDIPIRAAEARRMLEREALFPRAEDELARMWEDYQNPEYPIAGLVFAWVHGKVASPQEARAAWEKIPEEQRYAALEWFFDELWPSVETRPEVFGTELKLWQNVKDFLDLIGITDVRKQAVPEARGRPPGMAAPMPMGEGVPPPAPTGEAMPPPVPPEQPPPVPPEEEPPPPRYGERAFVPPGPAEEAEYDQARAEMQNWVAGGKEGDWTPLMEKWFGRETLAGNFWEYYWDQIPPGRIADEVRKDPIIEMLLNKAFRTVYDVKPGAYEAALETLQAWREANPDLPGDPKEWAIVRQITAKYWELKNAGATNEATALWRYFASLLEEYYPSEKPTTTKRYRRRGGGGRRRRRKWAKWAKWRRWPKIRYYPRR